MLKLIRVFSVGFGPAALGSVLMFYKFEPRAGGTMLLRLKAINAFLIGRRPGDWRLRRPKICRLTSYSLVTTYSWR